MRGTDLCFLPASLRLPHVVEHLDHLLVNDEDYGHVQAHAAQPRNRAFVEPAGKSSETRSGGEKSKLEGQDVCYLRMWSFMFQDLEGAVQSVFVAVGI